LHEQEQKLKLDTNSLNPIIVFSNNNPLHKTNSTCQVSNSNAQKEKKRRTLAWVSLARWNSHSQTLVDASNCDRLSPLDGTWAKKQSRFLTSPLSKRHLLPLQSST